MFFFGHLQRCDIIIECNFIIISGIIPLAISCVPGLLKCIAKQGYLASRDPTEAKAYIAQFQTAYIILMRIRPSSVAFTAQLAHRLRCSSDGVGNVPSSAARATWPSTQIYGCHPAVLLLRPRRHTCRCVRVLHRHSYQRGPSHVSICPSTKRGRGDTQRGDHPLDATVAQPPHLDIPIYHSLNRSFSASSSMFTTTARTQPTVPCSKTST